MGNGFLVIEFQRQGTDLIIIGTIDGAEVTLKALETAFGELGSTFEEDNEL